MTEHSIDSIFLEGNMERIDEHTSKKLENEASKLDADNLEEYIKIARDYNFWTEYDFDIFLLVNRVINYLAYKTHLKKAA